MFIVLIVCLFSLVVAIGIAIWGVVDVSRTLNRFKKDFNKG